MKKSAPALSLASSDFLSAFSFRPLARKEDFLLVLEPKSARTNWGSELIKWAVSHRKQFEELILQFGGIVFKNFHLTPGEFKAFANALYPKGVISDYSGGNAPREKVDDDGLFLATTAH